MHFRRLAIVAIFLGSLAGCIDDEERAQKHYENAIVLLNSGDTERGIIELRNALQKDVLHEDARRRFADEILRAGDVDGAYLQYVRLIEQYPDTVDVRRLLAEIALDMGDWDAVERHGKAAFELNPDVPEHQALATIIDYNNAKTRNDLVAVQEAVTQAQALLRDNPDLDTALRQMIDWYATGPEPGRALPFVDDLLGKHPESMSLMMARLRALDSLGREADIGDGLRDMYARFPESTEISDLLLSWYLSRDDVDNAEAFLRENAGPDDGEPEGHFTVVRLLQDTRGTDAALAELDRLSTANDGSDLGRRYALQGHLLRLQSGVAVQPEAMETIVAKMEDADLKNDGRFLLSRLYATLGDAEEAASLIDIILEDDPSHVDALMTRASNQIRSGNSAAAVTNLRSALDQAPRNVQALLVMAIAQQQLGNVELAEQRLAQAVEVSNSGPEPVMAYAQFQIARGNLNAAEQVLTDSLVTRGIDLRVSAMLADVQMELDDLAGARGLLTRLVEADMPEADQLIRSLRSMILFRENRVEESLQFLRTSLDESGGDADELTVELQILQINMLSRRFDKAHAQIDDLRARFPDQIALRIIEGNIFALEGKLEDAIATFYAILQDDPDQSLVYQRLYTLLKQSGQAESAVQVLRDGP